MAEAAEDEGRGASRSILVLVRALELGRRRAPLVAGCTLVSVALAVAAAVLQAPVYRATAELLVAPRSLQVVGRDILRTDGSASLGSADVDSQALVMVSTAVLRRVADGLDLADDPAYRPHPGLLSRLLGAQAGSGGSRRGDETLDLLKQSVAIQRVDDALVFRITASHPRASRAAEVANAMADAYLRVTAQERVDAVERADTSIASQVSGLRDRLDAAEAAVERFRGANGLVRSSETGLVVTQRLGDLYTEIDAAAAEVSRLAARDAEAARIGPDGLAAAVVPDALDAPTLVALRSQYADLARDAASQDRTLLPQHPHMLELRAELAEIRIQMSAELGRVRGALSDRLARATDTLAKLRAKAGDLTRAKTDSSEAETKLRRLESEAQAIRAVYDASLDRGRELDQQGRIETGHSRLLSEATPPSRSARPPLPVVAAVAAMFGLGLGFGLAALADTVSRRAGAGRATARDSSHGLPVVTTVMLPRSGAVRGEDAAALAAALGPVASGLRATLGSRLPALVAVVATRGAAGLQASAGPLAQALADLGEDVLLCDGGDPSGGLAVRRIGGRRASGRRPWAAGRGEFVVTAVDLADARSQALENARSADAFVLVADVAHTGADALQEAAEALDPSRRRIVALLIGDAPRRRPTEAAPSVRAAA